MVLGSNKTPGTLWILRCNKSPVLSHTNTRFINKKGRGERTDTVCATHWHTYNLTHRIIFTGPCSLSISVQYDIPKENHGIQSINKRGIIQNQGEEKEVKKNSRPPSFGFHTSHIGPLASTSTIKAAIGRYNHKYCIVWDVTRVTRQFFFYFRNV